MARSSRIGSIFIDFFARNEKFIAAVKGNNAALLRQQQQLKNLRNSARRLRRTMRALTSSFAGFLGVAGVGALASTLNNTIKQAGAAAVEISNLSAAVGLSAEEFQRYDNVLNTFRLTTVDTFDLLKEFQVRLQEAFSFEGSTPIEAFDAIGLSFEKLQEQGLSTAELFDVIRARLADLRAEGQDDLVLSFLDGLTGDQGTRYLDVLSLSNQEWNKIAGEVSRVNILTDEHVEGLAALGSRYSTTGRSIQRSIQSIVAANLDTFETLIDTFENVIPRAFNQLTNAITFLQDNLVILRGSFFLLVTLLLQKTGVLQFAKDVTVLSIAMVRGRVAADVYAAALVRVKSALISTGIGAAIVLIGEIIAWIYRLVIRTGGIGPAFREAWRLVSGYTKAAYDYITRRAEIGFNSTRQHLENFVKVNQDLLEVIRNIFEDSFIKIVNSGVVLFQGLRAEVIGWIRFALVHVEEWVNNSGKSFNKVAALFIVAVSNIEVAWQSSFNFLDEVTGGFLGDLEGNFDGFFRRTLSNFQQIGEATNSLSLMNLVLTFLPTIDPEVAEDVGEEAGRKVAVSYEDAIRRVEEQGAGTALFSGAIEALRRLENEATRLGLDALFTANEIDVLANATAGATAAIDDFIATALTIDLTTAQGIEDLNREWRALINLINQGREAYLATAEALDAFVEGEKKLIQGRTVATEKGAMEQCEAFDKVRKCAEMTYDDIAQRSDTFTEDVLKKNFDLAANFQVLWEGITGTISSTMDIAYESLEQLNLSVVNSFGDLKDAVDDLGKAIQREILNRLAKNVLGFALNLVAPGLGSFLSGFQNIFGKPPPNTPNLSLIHI